MPRQLPSYYPFQMSKFFGQTSSEPVRDLYEHIPVPEVPALYQLGEYNTFGLLGDAKRVGFLFARYKFAAKMLHGSKRILEIGCQEGLGTLLIAQVAEQVVATDFYKPHVESCVRRYEPYNTNIEFRGHDILDGPVPGGFDGALSLDVFEHIDPEQEDVYLRNVAGSLNAHGIFVLGIPSLESQAYASPASKAGHINCKTGEDLRAVCSKHFHQVFMFGMNDEVLHTGFLPMAHYLLALCAEPRR